MSGESSGTFSYGGLVASFNQHWKQFGIELSLLGGGGGGTINLTYSAGGVVLEPNIAISFVLGETVHTSFNMGYIWLPNTTQLTAVTAGLRFEFITDPEQFQPASQSRKARPAAAEREKDNPEPTAN